MANGVTNEQRYALTARGRDTAEAGLIRKRDGTSWVVQPDGSEQQLPGGGGSQPGAVREIGPLPFQFDTPGLGPLAVAIVAVDDLAQTFTIAGDFAALLPPTTQVTVAGSTGNDGQYTVTTAVFGGGNTTITVVETPPDSTPDGTLEVPGGGIDTGYVTAVGDVLLNAWFAFDPAWDQVALCDIGNGDSSGGIFYAVALGPVDALSNSGEIDSGHGFSYTDSTTSGAYSLLESVLAADSYRETVIFNAAFPLKLWVTQNGQVGGAATGAAAGSGELYLRVATPAAP